MVLSFVCYGQYLVKNLEIHEKVGKGHEINYFIEHLKDNSWHETNFMAKNTRIDLHICLLYTSRCV